MINEGWFVNLNFWLFPSVVAKIVVAFISIPKPIFQLQNRLFFVGSCMVESDYIGTIPIPNAGCPTFRMFLFGFFLKQPSSGKNFSVFTSVSLSQGDKFNSAATSASVFSLRYSSFF